VTSPEKWARPIRCLCSARIGTETESGISVERNGELIAIDEPFSRVRIRCYSCGRTRTFFGKLK
jgi:hypothetical protein